MTILITGGAGYIGSHVVLACLEAGYHVAVLDNFSNSSPEAVRRIEALSGKQVTLHRGDVRDEALLDSILQNSAAAGTTGGPINAVMHFAGLKAVGESVAKPLDYYDVNVAGTIVLTKAMARAGIYRLVFSSTASVYGDQAEMPLTEQSALGQPASPYGQSKLMVEHILADAARSDPRWAIAILRYFNPAGAHPSGQIGEDPKGEPANLIPYAMQVAVGRRQSLSVYGDDYPTPDGTGVRDYIHVMDLAEGHLAALRYIISNAGGHIWNLGTGQGHSVLEVIRGLEQVIGHSLPWTKAPRRMGDTALCWADPSRAAYDLGWKAQKSFEEMLADHWRWQSQNPNGYQA